jgi:CarboxypepD_reg-like domain
MQMLLLQLKIKMLKSYLVSSILFLSLVVQSQNSIKGRVFDKKNNEAIVGAIVRIEKTNIAVYSDFDGNFELKDLKEEHYNLEISYVSYVPVVLKTRQ